MTRRVRLRLWQADVKEHQRRPFAPADLLVEAPSKEQARQEFAFIYDVPERWVRVRPHD